MVEGKTSGSFAAVAVDSIACSTVSRDVPFPERLVVWDTVLVLSALGVLAADSTD